MDILSAYEDGIHYFGFVGQFDTTDVEQFQAHVEEAVDAQHFKIAINLGQMTFINSTALGYLVAIAKRLKDIGGELVFSAPSRFFADTIRTLELHHLFEIFPSDQEAALYFVSGTA